MSRYSVDIQAQLKGFTEIENKLKSLSSKPIDVKINVTGIDGDLSKQISNQLSSIGKSVKTDGKSIGNEFLSGLTGQVIGSSSQYAKMQAKIANEIKKTTGKITPVIAQNLNNATDKEIESLSKKTAQKYVDASIKASDQAKSKISSNLQKANSAQWKQYFQSIGSKSDIQKEMSAYYTEQAKQAEQQAKLIQKNLVNEKSLANFQRNIQAYYESNTKMHQKYGDQVQDILNRSLSPDIDKKGLNQLQTEYAKLQRNISADGLLGKSFGDELSRGFRQIGQFVGTYGAYIQIIDLLKSMANEVINVDSAMTELRKVSNASASDIDNYFSQAAEDAKSLGSSISDVISNTADWSRLGYDLPDAQELSRLTTLYQTVGDNMTQESASSSLISTLQGFQMLPDEAEHIVDSFNEVGKLIA